MLRALTKIDIALTHKFHIFFSSLARSKYMCIFMITFTFRAKPKFFFLLLIISVVDGCILLFLFIIIYSFRVFQISFRWSLSDSKSPQVPRNLLSVLAVLKNVIVWMVSIRPSTSKSSSPFDIPLVTLPKAPITIEIIVTFMFHNFFNCLARSRYLSFISHSFSFIRWSAGTAKSSILQVLFFFFFFWLL